MHILVREKLNFVRIYFKILSFPTLAGKAGSSSIANYGKTVSRLSGLDPAGPLYYLSLSPADMIYKGNGGFVDLYHTSRGKLGDARTNTGDIDVYVNGGAGQPGCTAFEVVPG